MVRRWYQIRYAFKLYRMSTPCTELGAALVYSLLPDKQPEVTKCT